ncbi:MAG: hypothetical protein PUE30_06835 [Spirochaetia bacterium]|nr:hypothetical protein [Spirochaetia bacterium]
MEEEFDPNEIDKINEEFDREFKEIEEMGRKISYCIEMLGQAQKEYEKIQELEKILKENPNRPDSEKIKEEIAELSKSIENICDSLLVN